MKLIFSTFSANATHQLLMTDLEMQQMQDSSTNLQNYVFDLESKIEHTKAVSLIP